MRMDVILHIVIGLHKVEVDMTKGRHVPIFAAAATSAVTVGNTNHAKSKAPTTGTAICCCCGIRPVSQVPSLLVHGLDVREE